MESREMAFFPRILTGSSRCLMRISGWSASMSTGPGSLACVTRTTVRSPALMSINSPKCLTQVQMTSCHPGQCILLRHASDIGRAGRKSATSQKKDIIVDKSAYKGMYKFNHILLVRALSMMKLYQTGLTLCACPVLGYAWHIGKISELDLMFGAGIALVATSMLYLMSSFIRRIVGILYLHEDGKKVLVSHLTFWGNRRDIVLDINNIVPITDENQNVFDVYVRLSTYDSSESFILFLKYGSISDKDALLKVLGDIKLQQ